MNVGLIIHGHNECCVFSTKSIKSIQKQTNHCKEEETKNETNKQNSIYDHNQGIQHTKTEIT